MKIKIICSYCGNESLKEKKEIERRIRIGKKYFFCSISCGASFSNLHREGHRVEVEKICPYCKNSFITLSGCKSKTFCSSSCAALGSVTPAVIDGRKRGGAAAAKLQPYSVRLKSAQNILAKREAWKYEKIKTFLESFNINHQFEFKIENFIFDLALIDKKILIEFDAKDHHGKTQKITDNKKDLIATSQGWIIYRKEVKPKTIINPELLYDFVK